MNLKRRVVLSIVRKPIKTIVSFLVVLLLSVLLSLGFSTHYAIQQTEMNLRSRLPAIATLDWEHRATSVAFPTIEMIESIGELPYVLDYDIRSRTILYADDLEWALPEIDKSRLPESITEEEIIGYLGASGNFRSMGGNVNRFWVLGINNPYLADVQTGLISLTSGRFMTEDELETGANVAIISQLFADVNNIDIGSNITLENSVFNDEKIVDYATPTDGMILGFRYWHLDEFIIANQPVELEVVGIFDIERDFLYPDNYQRTSIMTSLVSELYNTIYIPRQLQLELADYLAYYEPEFFFDQETEDQPLLLESVFLLHDPRDADDFAQAAAEILPEYWFIYDTSDGFSPYISSMDDMLWIADLIFYGTLVVTVIILSLLFTLLLHERRHETGIYLALGESKRKVISQLLIEVMVVSAIATTFAFFIGNQLSQILSREMLLNEFIKLEDEIPAEFIDTPHEFIIFTTERMSAEELISFYDVSLNFSTALLFFGSQLGSILLASFISIIYLLRLDPKRILTLHN